MATLADQTRRGAVWVTAQTVLARIVSMVANLFLAWFLIPEDFGVYGLAATIAAFCEVFGAGGISSILIVRQKAYKKWCTPALWLSVLLGIVVLILMNAGTWLGTQWIDVERPRQLLRLVAIMSVVPLFNSIATVPGARLRIQMRFKELAIISTVTQTISAVGKIGLAAAGLGALSFVIPNAVAAFARAVWTWLVSGIELQNGFRINKWKFLVRDAAMLMMTALMFKIITFGDYAILSFFVSREEMGYYFFAYTYSVMGVVLLTTGLASVLVPAFAKLDDLPRQFAAFFRSTKLVAAIVFPVCALQAAVCGPLIELFLPKWTPAIPLLQILSLGMAGRTISWLAASLMESQGRFKTRMRLGIISAILFLAMATAGVMMGRLHGLAIAVATYYPIMSFLNTYVAIYRSPAPGHSILEVCSRPLTATVLSIGGAWMISRWQFEGADGRLVLTTLLGTLSYVVVLRVFMKEQWNEIVEHLSKPLVGKFFSFAATISGATQGKGRS